MPFETVDEAVVQQRHVKVCARCRGRMEEKVKHRGAWTTAGSVGGSLGTSLGGSMLMGSVLGPVGAIGGAIGGSIIGSRLGANASSGACDAIEATADDVCDRCKEASRQRASTQTNWGGGRLGSSEEPTAFSGQSSAAPPGGASQRPQQGEESGITDRIGDVASATGETLSKAASATGETLSKAASATGETLSQGWSRLSTSISSSFGARASAEPQASKGTSVPFAGSGRVLGSGAPEGSARPISRLVGGSVPQAPVPPVRRSQMEEDEALARQLQEQFLQEER